MDPAIVSTRVFQVPREVLFQAFADPRILAEWWGPAGFTNEFQEFDLRPGGGWTFVMRSPDRTEFPMMKRFVEVVPLERIVVQHDQGEHTHSLAMTYADEGAGTRLTWRMHFELPAEAERVRAVVEQANEQNFDRLEALLTFREVP